MDILIIENEAPVAVRMQELTTEILGERVGVIRTESLWDKGFHVFKNEHPDLLLLDLNMEDHNSFQRLEEVTAESGLTILFSDQAQQAAEAFQYGVLDVVPKSFTKDHMAKALDCFLHPSPSEPDGGAVFLSIVTSRGLRRVPVKEINNIKRMGRGSQLELDNGEVLQHSKTLDQLMLILPHDFERIHKSMIVSLKSIVRMSMMGSRCMVELENGTVLPIGRRRQRLLKSRIEAADLSLKP